MNVYATSAMQLVRDWSTQVLPASPSAGVKGGGLDSAEDRDWAKDIRMLPSGSNEEVAQKPQKKPTVNECKKMSSITPRSQLIDPGDKEL